MNRMGYKLSYASEGSRDSDYEIVADRSKRDVSWMEQ